MTFQEPFSGAYLHKLFLHCSIFKVHAFTARLLGGSLYRLSQEFRFVKNFFILFKTFQNFFPGAFGIGLRLSRALG